MTACNSQVSFSAPNCDVPDSSNGPMAGNPHRGREEQARVTAEYRKPEVSLHLYKTAVTRALFSTDLREAGGRIKGSAPARIATKYAQKRNHSRLRSS
jgi:hypothetical protein